MKICYEVTSDDVLALNLHQSQHTPALQRRWRVASLVASLMFGVGIFAAFRVITAGPLPSALLALIVLTSVLMFWTTPRLIRTGIAQHTRQQIHVGQYKGVLGGHELSFSERGISATTPIGEALILWRAVDSVTVTYTHIFVFAGTQILIVPRRAFLGDEYCREFLRTIERRRRSTVAPI